MAKEVPIEELFEKRARGIAHILRDRTYAGRQLDTAYSHNHRFYTERRPGDNEEVTVVYKHANDSKAWAIALTITPSKAADVVFGDEHLSKAEVISDESRTFDNRKGIGDITIDRTKEFGDSTDSETEKDESAGTSVEVQVESEQDVEGVASFRESVTAEAHAEIAKRQSKSESHSDDDTEETNTVLRPGQGIVLHRKLERQSGETDVTAHGVFDCQVHVGWYHGGGFHKHHGHSMFWASWDDFVDCVKGDAPDNWPMATSFKDHPPWHADLWALDPVAAPLEYRVKFEGRITEEFRIETMPGSKVYDDEDDFS